MKAYKVEILIIDFDNLGATGIKDEFENTNYVNHCMDPNVMKIEEKEIGEWDDDHPLNKKETKEKYYIQLFSE